MEHLRHVARSHGLEHQMLAAESACALAGFGGDPGALVTACRRMVSRQANSGPTMWVAARMLAASDPSATSRELAEMLSDDPTARLLARELPDEARVVTVGWSTLIPAALRRRGDVAVAAVGGSGTFLRRLRAAEIDVADVADAALGVAVAEADLVLLETWAAGSRRFAAELGSLAAAAVARHSGTPVWLTAGLGAFVHEDLWRRIERSLVGVDATLDAVDLDLVDRVATPGGVVDVSAAVAAADRPRAPELTRDIG